MVAEVVYDGSPKGDLGDCLQDGILLGEASSELPELPFFSGFQSLICYKALLSLHNGFRREETMHHVTGK